MLLPPQQCAGVDYRTGSAGFGRAPLSVFNKPPDPATRRPRPIIGLVELLALAGWLFYPVLPRFVLRICEALKTEYSMGYFSHARLSVTQLPRVNSVKTISGVDETDLGAKWFFGRIGSELLFARSKEHSDAG